MPKKDLQKHSDWKSIITEYSESGKNAKQFCRDKQINYPQFYYYKNSLSPLNAAKSPFIELRPSTFSRLEFLPKISLEFAGIKLCFEGVHDHKKIAELFLTLRGLG